MAEGYEPRPAIYKDIEFTMSANAITFWESQTAMGIALYTGSDRKNGFSLVLGNGLITFYQYTNGEPVELWHK